MEQPTRPDSQHSRDARYPLMRVILGVLAALALLAVIVVVVRCTSPATEDTTMSPDVQPPAGTAQTPDSSAAPANATTPSSPSQRPPN